MKWLSKATRLSTFSLALIVGVSVFASVALAVSVLSRIADHDPTGNCGNADDGWNQAVGYTADTGKFYSFGGGTLGTAPWCSQGWEWDPDTDTWSSVTGLTTGEKFGISRSYASSDTRVGMVSDILSGCDTYIYNALTDSMNTPSDPPSSCNFGGYGATIGEIFWFCHNGVSKECYSLDMTSPVSWTAQQNMSTTSVGTTGDGCMIYDENENALFAWDASGNAAVYAISVGGWVDMTDPFPFTGITSVCFYDNFAGLLVGQMDNPGANQMDIYQLVIDDTNIEDSAWSVYETWNSVDFAYDSGSGNREYSGAWITEEDNQSRTHFVFGPGTTSLANPAVNGIQWWEYAGEAPALAVEPPENSIDNWLENVLSEYRLSDKNGKVFVSIAVAFFIMFAMALVRVHPVIIIVLEGLWASAAAVAVLLPPAVVLTMAAVVGIGMIWGVFLLRGRGNSIG